MASSRAARGGAVSPLLWRPRLPPGVVTSSRPPRAPGLARPRHPAASSEKSGAELRGSPEDARRPGLRGPGTGISRPAAAAEGGGLERGPALVIRVPGPGGGRAGSEREVRPPWNLDIARGKPRAGGRAMAQAGCGAGAGGRARCMAVCRRSRPRGLSGWWPREEWVHRAPRREAGRTRGPGKVPSPSCPPSSVPGLAAGPLWTAAWPHPHPGSLPLYSALRLLPQDS